MTWTGIDPTKWADNSDGKLTALLRNSVQGLANVMGQTIPNGGRIPVITGNLARSVVISNTPPTVKEGDAKGDVASGIAAIRPGETIYAGWQAVYSRRVDQGFVGTDSLGRTYNQSGAGFSVAAAAQWPTIVLREAQKLAGK